LRNETGFSRPLKLEMRKQLKLDKLDMSTRILDVRLKRRMAKRQEKRNPMTDEKVQRLGATGAVRKVQSKANLFISPAWQCCRKNSLNL
jgi:hypothetical protein